MNNLWVISILVSVMCPGFLGQTMECGVNDVISSRDTLSWEKDCEKLTTVYICKLSLQVDQYNFDSNMYDLLPAFKQNCRTDVTGCDMVGIVECIEKNPAVGISFDGYSMVLAVVNVYNQCGQLDDLQTCLQPKVEQCRNNERISDALGRIQMTGGYVCSHKQEIQDIAVCIRYSDSAMSLGQCELRHPLSRGLTEELQEQICNVVNDVATCMEEAMEQGHRCSEKETNSLITMLRDVYNIRLSFKDENPCDSGDSTLYLWFGETPTWLQGVAEQCCAGRESVFCFINDLRHVPRKTMEPPNQVIQLVHRHGAIHVNGWLVPRKTVEPSNQVVHEEMKDPSNEVLRNVFTNKYIFKKYGGISIWGKIRRWLAGTEDDDGTKSNDPPCDLFIVGIVLICITVTLIMVVVGLGIHIKRKGRLPCKLLQNVFCNKTSTGEPGEVQQAQTTHQATTKQTGHEDPVYYELDTCARPSECDGAGRPAIGNTTGNSRLNTSAIAGPSTYDDTALSPSGSQPLNTSACVGLSAYGDTALHPGPKGKQQLKASVIATPSTYDDTALHPKGSQQLNTSAIAGPSAYDDTALHLSESTRPRQDGGLRYQSLDASAIAEPAVYDETGRHPNDTTRPRRDKPEYQSLDTTAIDGPSVYAVTGSRPKETTRPREYGELHYQPLDTSALAGPSVYDVTGSHPNEPTRPEEDGGSQYQPLNTTAIAGPSVYDVFGRHSNEPTRPGEDGGSQYQPLNTSAIAGPSVYDVFGRQPNEPKPEEDGGSQYQPLNTSAIAGPSVYDVFGREPNETTIQSRDGESQYQPLDTSAMSGPSVYDVTGSHPDGQPPHD